MDFLGVNSTAVVAGGAAVSAALVTAFTSAWASKRISYASSVTTERSKWVNLLRENITALTEIFYLHAAQFIIQDDYYKSEDARKNTSKMLALSTSISLQLRPEGLVEENVFILLRSCVELATRISRTERDSGTLFVIYIDLLILHCRWLMKFEWERVKIEFNIGFQKVFLRMRLRSMLRSYVFFSNREGHFDPIFSEEDTQRQIDLSKRSQATFLFRRR